MKNPEEPVSIIFKIKIWIKTSSNTIRFIKEKITITYFKAAFMMENIRPTSDLSWIEIENYLKQKALISKNLKVDSVATTALGKIWIQIKKFFFLAKDYRLEAVISSISNRLLLSHGEEVDRVIELLTTRVSKLKGERANRLSKIISGIRQREGHVESTANKNVRKVPAQPSLLQREDDQKMRLEILEGRCENISFMDPAGRQVRFNRIMAIYNDGNRPSANRSNLLNYIASEVYLRHAKSIQVYYNSDDEMEAADVMRVMTEREPVNLFASNQDSLGTPYFDSDAVFKLFGHRMSVYNSQAVKENGKPFYALPNSVSVYAETPLWRVPGWSKRIEIACLSVPAPALDAVGQPHFDYYMSKVQVEGQPDGVMENRLNIELYRKEMNHLAQVVIQATVDHQTSAFEGKGIQRLVISRYGQANFLAQVTHPLDRQAAKDAYYASLREEVIRRKNELGNLPIVISEYGKAENEAMRKKFVLPLQAKGFDVGIINGDILTTATEGDLIVNAWDPHSLPGNGNDNDRSLDGVLGKGTAILLTQSGWINGYFNKDCLRLVYSYS